MTDLTKQLEAIAVLIAQGKTPTYRAIRKLSGGSFNTIQMALDEHNTKNHVIDEVPTAAVDIPERIRQATNELSAQMWSVATTVANEEMRPERERYASENVRLNEKLQSAETTIDELCSDFDKAEATIEARDEEIRSLRAELRDLIKERDTAKSLVEHMVLTEEKLHAVIRSFAPGPVEAA